VSDFRLVRDHMDLTPTTGTLYCPPDLSLFTLELPWLANAAGVSCIPVGKYRCIFSMSARWKKLMPELLNVPGRSSIRIHGGNTTADTEGCILLGMGSLGGVLSHSQKALGYFTDWLSTAIHEGPVYCEVVYDERA
jgi:hypothetical protein